MADYYMEQHFFNELDVSLRAKHGIPLFEDDLISQTVRRRLKINWHDALPGEPPCGPQEWRTKNRQLVLKMCEMQGSHLEHCFRFADSKSQHGSRRQELMKEIRRRRKMAAHWGNPKQRKKTKTKLYGPCGMGY